jgi:hypothetical protein
MLGFRLGRLRRYPGRSHFSDGQYRLLHDSSRDILWKDKERVPDLLDYQDDDLAQSRSSWPGLTPLIAHLIPKRAQFTWAM